MRTTFGVRPTRRARSTLAIVLAAMVVLLGSASPAGASAAPPRDPSQFACPPESPNPFTDIDGSVHEASIRCAAAYGFINGTTSTTFSPGAPVTRGQIASFLARLVAFSGTELDTSDQGFTDIADSVHKDAINGLTALGAINGTSPSTFSPNQAVTRAQLASIVARLLSTSTPLPDAPDAFSDDDGSVHEPNINVLAVLGIVGGVTADQFDPNGSLTRAAAASVLARVQDFSVQAQISSPLGGSDVIRAALTGGAEASGPGDAAAKGTVELFRSHVDGLLCLTIDFDVALSGTPTEVHIHQGNVGVVGPDVVTIPPPPSGSGFQSACFPGFNQPTLDQVFANPSAFYFDVHTAAFPDGAVRGQLTAPAANLASALLGDEEAPGPGETDGFGGVSLDTMTDGTTIGAAAIYSGSGAPVAAHIHEGAAGAAGPIVVTLPPFDDIYSDGCVGGLDPAVVADIAAHPADYYVNIHTDAFPNGAIRGQLERTVSLSTSLTGAAEVPGPGDPGGSGDATIDLLGDDLLCDTIHVRGTAKPTSAHIHRAAAGAAGPIVVVLPTPTFNTSTSCMLVDSALYDEIASSPESFYVNVHTSDHPDGAVRGQVALADQAGAARTTAPMAATERAQGLRALRFRQTGS